MGNEVANPFGGSVALKDRKAMAEKAAASAQNTTRQGAPDGSDYLNFSGKRGLYTLGQDKTTVTEDELWVLNIASFEDGWVGWKGGRPFAQRLSNIYTGVPVATPDPSEGGPFDSNKGEGWFQAKAWVSKSLDTDKQAYFKNNSVSGVAEMADMIEEVSRRMAVGQPCWPVFNYSMEEFESQGYKNFKPLFKVYGWLDDEAMGKLDDDDVDIDVLIEQSATTEMLPKGKQESKQEDSQEEAAPDPEPAPATTRRRRRRSA